MVDFSQVFRRQEQFGQPGGESAPIATADLVPAAKQMRQALAAIRAMGFSEQEPSQGSPPNPRAEGGSLSSSALLRSLQQARTDQERRAALETIAQELRNPDLRNDIARTLLHADPPVIEGLIRDLSSPNSRIRLAATELLVAMGSGTHPAAVSLRDRLRDAALPSSNPTLEDRRRLENIVQRIDDWRRGYARREGRVTVFRDSLGRTTEVYTPDGELYLSVRYANNQENSPIAEARDGGGIIPSINRQMRNGFEEFSIHRENGETEVFHFDARGWIRYRLETRTGLCGYTVRNPNFRQVSQTVFRNGRLEAIVTYLSDGSSETTYYNRPGGGTQTVIHGPDGLRRDGVIYTFRPPRP
jgi:hypothetical protein